MPGWKESARGGADRFLKPYFDPLEEGIRAAKDDVHVVKDDVDVVKDDVDVVKDDVHVVTDEVRGLRQSTDTRLDHSALRLQQLLDEVQGVRGSTDTRLDHSALRLQQLLDEVGGVRESSDTRLDLANLRLHQILDEVGGVRDRVERLEQRFGEVEADLVYQLEGQAQRQTELRTGFDELWQATKQTLEKLELLFMAQLEGLFGAVHSETDKLRKDVVELTRMLRMQGDAADQVAEALGRTFTRLSAEVESLSEAVGQLRAGADEATSPA
jgi:ubiquinone biosynthesis protein UbiJ